MLITATIYLDKDALSTQIIVSLCFDIPSIDLQKMQHHRVLVEILSGHARYLCCNCNAEINQARSKSFFEWANEVQLFRSRHPFDAALFQVGGGCKITLGRILKSARAERNWTAEQMCEAIAKTGNAVSVSELMDIEESIADVRSPSYYWLIDSAIKIFDLTEEDRPWLEKLQAQTYSTDH